MKQSIFLLVFLSTCLTGCYLFPSDNGVKEGHFRVTNLTDEENNAISHVYTMCHKQKPASWVSARQYPSGKQTLWVKATVQKIGVANSYREAHINFAMDFPEGGNFQLAHKIEHDTISIWLQDPDSLSTQSPVVTTELQPDKPVSSDLVMNYCNQSAI